MASMEVNVNVQDTEVFKRLVEEHKILKENHCACVIALCFVIALCIVQAVCIQKLTVKLAESQQTAKDYAVVADEATTLAKRAITKLEQVQKQTVVEIKTEEPAEAEPELSMETIEKIEELPGRILTVTATAYCPCPFCCGIWSEQHPSRIGTGYVQKTSSGTIPTAGRTIAVDPSVIPMGSEVWIKDHKYIAEDTGNHIKGNRIDIFFDSHQEALNWGMRNVEVRVYDN